eukprot:3240888-Amphidinium_carterae.1
MIDAMTSDKKEPDSASVPSPILYGLPDFGNLRLTISEESRSQPQFIDLSGTKERNDNEKNGFWPVVEELAAPRHSA